MKTVIFARHGETEANVAGILAGARTDTLLTEKGREHGTDLGRMLAEAGKEIDLVVASTLSRAYETAVLAAQEMGYTKEIVRSPLFVERDFGSASSRPKAEAYAMLDTGAVEDEETIVALANRARQAMEWLRARPEDRILVVSHAGFGQMFGTVVAGDDPKDFLSYNHLSNGDAFEITLK